VIVKASDIGSPDVETSYAILCSGLIEACRILGLEAQLHPGGPRACPNIIIGGKKISGNAQAWRRGVILQHGTFLVEVNLAKMFTVLKVPWPLPLEEVVRKAEKKITSIGRELSRPVSVCEAYEALREGFSRALGVELIPDELTDFELELAERLKETKYSSNDWNFKGVGKAERVICMA